MRKATGHILHVPERGSLLISSLTATDHLVKVPLSDSVETTNHLVLMIRWRLPQELWRQVDVKLLLFLPTVEKVQSPFNQWLWLKLGCKFAAIGSQDER